MFCKFNRKTYVALQFINFKFLTIFHCISAKSKGWFGRTDSVESKPRYIGITMLTLTPSIINEMRLRGEFQNVTYGVFIHRVIVGSPADK